MQCNVLSCLVLYCIVLYCIVLYCIVYMYMYLCKFVYEFVYMCNYAYTYTYMYSVKVHLRVYAHRWVHIRVQRQASDTLECQQDSGRHSINSRGISDETTLAKDFACNGHFEWQPLHGGYSAPARACNSEAHSRPASSAAKVFRAL